MTSAESKATYKEIQEYVLKEHGLKVSNLYISQIKRKSASKSGREGKCYKGCVDTEVLREAVNFF